MTTRKAFILSVLMLLVSLVASALSYPFLPDQMPSHWNIHGQVDATGSKLSMLLLFAALSLLAPVMIAGGSFLSPKTHDPKMSLSTWNWTFVLVQGLMLFIQAVSLAASFAAGFDSGRVLVAGLMGFLILLGNVMGRLSPNFYAGIRTPWTLANEEVWKKTHRVAGRWFVGGGSVGLVLAVFGAPMWVAFLIIMVASLWPVLYSFLISKKIEKGGVMLLTLLALTVVGRADAAEREITFTSTGGITLKGTFLPAEGKADDQPAMLLLPGSGPTDRNGNQPPGLKTDLLKQLAEALAKSGYATLRFDKRAAHTNAALWPKDLEELDAFFSWPHHLDDATAALKSLRDQAEVDPTRVGVLGHSEGGLIALSMTARMPAIERPKVLVLASTAGRTLKDVLLNQVTDQVKNAGALISDGDALLANLRQSVDAVIETGKRPQNVDPRLAALFGPGVAHYLQAVLPEDPLAKAGAFSGPLLIVQGELDVQVLASKDFPALAKAGRSRKGNAVTEELLVAHASHNLKRVDDPKKQLGFEGPVMTEVVNGLVRFLKSNL